MKVLVAIDNGPSSQATIDALIKTRWYEGTEIGLVTVFPPSDEPSTSEDEPTANFEQMENIAVELRNALRQCKVSFFPRYGDAKSVILDIAEQSNTDLIVVGSNCKSTLERLILGSVSQSILNAAKCPVIVAKAPCSLAREASPGFKTILVPIDNSVFSSVAVRWLGNFSWAPSTKFVVAAAVAENTDFEEVRRSLDQRAADLSMLLSTNNIITEVAEGEPQKVIIDLAKEYYSDLIVMGSHGHTGLQELILGSVSHSVTHVAPCAVAIVRGIAANDTSWHRTGAFSKLKPVFTPDFAAAYGGSRKRDDLSVNVMPAGF